MKRYCATLLDIALFCFIASIVDPANLFLADTRLPNFVVVAFVVFFALIQQFKFLLRSIECFFFDVFGHAFVQNSLTLVDCVVEDLIQKRWLRILIKLTFVKRLSSCFILSFVRLSIFGFFVWKRKVLLSFLMACSA